MSIFEMLCELERWRVDRHGWEVYGVVPVTDEALARIRAELEPLLATNQRGEVYPTVDGDVELLWHLEGALV